MEKAEPEKNLWHGQYMRQASERTLRSSPSTAVQSRKIFLKENFSDMRRAPLPVRMQRSRARLNMPRTGLYSLTKSVNSLHHFRLSCCASSREKSSNVSAAARTFRLTPGLLQQPT